MQLARHPENPIIPRDPTSTWRHDHTACCVLFHAEREWRLYIRGRSHVENQYDTKQLIGTIFGGLFTASTAGPVAALFFTVRILGRSISPLHGLRPHRPSNGSSGMLQII